MEFLVEAVLDIIAFGLESSYKKIKNPKVKGAIIATLVLVPILLVLIMVLT